jgi:flagellar biosynthetic protein FliR
MDIFAKYIPNFLLILLRAGIFVSLLPFFGSGNFPSQMKIGIAAAIAFILTPVVELHITEKSIPLLVFNEIILGIAFGFVARFVFFAVEIAGQVISNSMGLTIAHVFNPEIGESTELSQFFMFIGMLIFLAMDAHHDLIYIFVKSYEWLPAGEITISKIVPAVISLGSMMFIIALKISAPVIIVMLISHILLGFIYKAAPQINIFFVAYPIYIFVGLFVMLIGLPVFVNVMGGYLNTIKDEMAKVIAVARG